MPRLHNHNQERHPSLPQRLLTLGVVLVIALMTGSIFFVQAHSGKTKGADASSSFGFTVTGDYDQTNATTSNLQQMKQLYNAQQIGFNIGLGDFNYSNNLTAAQAAAWSSYATSNLPNGFPFEILDGRHDSSQIATYEKDLPDRIGDISATCPTCAYGQQYYFDYPSPPAAPLARFILISPNQTIPGYTYNYNAGGADYNWVKNTIEDAKCISNGKPNPNCSHPVIPWTIVGMHEYCFVVGTAKCTNVQLLNLLLNEHVDVILQGQKHNYQRSKQLALTPTNGCSTLNASSYNAKCVVSDTDDLTQGAGSVIVLTGTGGASELKINTADPKVPYFKSLMPANNMTFGISQFTISSTKLTEHFVPVSGGTFQDSFTITAGGSTVTPTPTVTASPSVTPSPFPSPGTLLGQDTFQRGNQSLWGTASDGQKWAADANTLANFSIAQNSGQVVGNKASATSYTAVLGSSATNAQVQLSGSLSSFGGNTLGAVLHWTDSNNFYKAYITGTNLVIQKKVKGAITALKSTPFTAKAGTSYTILFNLAGTTLSASVWATGTPPPASWMLSTTDSSLPSGYCGLLVYLANGVTANTTSFQANSQ